MLKVQSHNITPIVSILTNVTGYRVAQVHVIFAMEEHLQWKKPLAYVQYFSPFTEQRPNSDMYVVRRSYRAGKREAAIILLDSIRCSCHLIPVFGSSVDPHWKSSNVLELCDSFFVNPYLNLDTFQMFIG